MGKQISLCIIMHFMQKEHFKKTIEKKRAQIVYLTSTLLIKVIGSLSSIFFLLGCI